MLTNDEDYCPTCGRLVTMGPANGHCAPPVTIPREVVELLADSVRKLRSTMHDSPERLCEKLGQADVALDEYRKAVARGE